MKYLVLAGLVVVFLMVAIGMSGIADAKKPPVMQCTFCGGGVDTSEQWYQISINGPQTQQYGVLCSPGCAIKFIERWREEN